MECKVIIDKEHKEEVIVYAHSKSLLTEKIEKLVNESDFELIGYADKQIMKLNLNEIYCFAVESNKIYAYTEKEKFSMKCRLYNLEEKLTKDFIKINQSAIVNVNYIERFDASITASMRVKLKNGYCDYVSRRQIKSVKERLGF